MRKNFTQLIGSLSRSKKYVIALTSLMILAGSVYLMAAVGISVSGTGSYTLDADLAAGSIFTPITNVVIKEGNGDDFASRTNYKIVLTAPEGWIFQRGGVSAVRNQGEVNLITTPSYVSDGIGARSIEFTLTAGNGTQNTVDQITISGLSIKSTNGIIDPTQPKLISVQVINTTASTTVSSSTPISLSQTGGAVKQLNFLTQPSDVLIGESIIPAIQVQARDQFGNIVSNPNVSLTLGANPSAGTLTAGTSSTSNGIVTFSGYSINRVGVGYTLVASATNPPSNTVAASVTSNSFTVNNRRPSIAAVSGCLSAGDAATTVTITGTNFVSGTTVLVNGQPRTATVASATSLTTILSASELATAGNLSIVVKNPAPVQDNGESVPFIKPVLAVLSAGAITGTNSVCPGEANIQYAVPANTNVKAYQWSVVSGSATISSGANSTNPRISFGNTPGIVQLSVVAYNQCDKPGPASTYSVTVKPTPIIAVAAMDNKTAICQGESVTLTASGADSYTWSGTGVTTGTSGNSITVTPSTTTAYTVVGMTDGCPSAPQTITINVTPTLTQGAITGVTEYCHNAAATVLTATVAGGASAKEYTWEKSSSGAVGSWTQAATSVDYRPITTEIGTTYYRRTVRSGACTVITPAIAVVVKPLPEAPQTTSADRCGAGIVELKASGVESGGNYRWYTAAEGGTLVNTGDTFEPNLSINTTYYVAAVSATGCEGISRTPVRATIYPVPNLIINNPAAVCAPATVDLEAAAITSGSTSGLTYTYWTNEDATIPLTNSGEVSASGTYYIKGTTAEGCFTIRPVTVTVNALPFVPEVTSNSRCGSGTVELGASVGATGNLVRWYTSATAESHVATGTSYTTPVIDKTTSYFVASYNTATGCESGRVEVKATVKELPIAEIDPLGPTNFCSGNSVVLAATEGNGYSYQWFKEGSSTVLGTEREFETNENGRYYVKVSLDGCTVTSATINVKVSENPDNVTVTADGPLTFCAGRSVRLDAPFRSTYTYVWEEKVGESYVQRSSARSLTVSSSGTYRVLVINEGLCEKYSDEITVTVLPQPTAAILTQGSTICQNPSRPTTFTVTGTYSGGTGTWAVTNGFSYVVESTNTDAEGLTTSTIIVTAPATISSPVNSVVSLTSTNPAANCGTQTRSITVGVQPVIAGNTIAGASNYCQGASATDLSSGTISGGNGRYTYQWQQSTSEDGTYTNVALGGTGISYRPSTATAGTMYYRRVVTSDQCSSTSNAIAVTVTPSITTNTISGKANYCKGEAGEALGGAVSGGNGSESYTYVWQSSTTGAANSWVNIANSNSADYTPQTSTASTTYYRRGVESGNCTTYSNIIAVTVTESISNNNIVTTAPVAGICTGTSPGTITGTPPSGGNGSFTYVWESSTESSTTGFGAITNATGPSYNTGNLSVTTWFRRVVKSGNCEVTSEAIQVKVNPVIANNSFTSLDQVICNGSAAAIITATSPTGGDGSYSYVWQRSTISATTGFSDIAISNTPNYNPGNLTTTTWFKRKVISGGCENTTSTAIRVTVNSQILGNTIAGNQIVCSGVAIAQLGQATNTTLAGGATPYSFQWERRVGTTGSWTEILGATAASYTPPAQTVTVATTTYYRRVVRGGGCSSTSEEVSVTVNPLPAKPTITNLRPVVYTADDPIEMRASHGRGTFTIRNAAGTTVSTSSTFSPCTLGAGTYTVTYTYSNENCPNTSDPVIVTVKATTFTAVIVASPFPICKGQNTEFTAMVYRDVIVVPVTDPRHPDHGQWLNETYAVRKNDPKRYWQDFVGVEPLDANGKLQPAPTSLIMNSGDIAAGDDFKLYKFTYRWFRNSNNIGNGRVKAKSAGLSASDEFYVTITPNLVSNLPCNPSTSTNAIRSNSMWLSAPTNYNMTLSAQNPICKGDGVRLTATPNVGFDFSSINLQVNFYIKKAGAPAESEPTRLNEFPITEPDPNTNPNAPITYSYDVAPGIIENGDVVSIFFSTDVVKCLTSGDAGSFLTMVVNERPAIAAQPATQTVCANTTATLTVGATGADLTYQWYKRPTGNPAGTGTPVTNGGRISGAATASLRIANASAGDAGLYYVIVGGFCPPTVPSENVELIVNPITAMTLQPAGDVMCPGASHTFTASATGTNLRYQWYKGTTTISGATSNSYTISNVVAGDAGNYTVVVTGDCGEVRSTVATLVVNEVPAITAQPNAATVCAGTTANFSVATSGTGVTYQWYKGATALSDGGNIAGARTNSLRLSNVRPEDAGEYRVVVSGTCSPAVTSDAVTLTVNTAPDIITNPVAQEVCAGEENITFSVAAVGTNLSYQWYHNGDLIPGATSSNYTVSVASTEKAGTYSVSVGGTCTPAVTSQAVLTVNPLPTVTAFSLPVCKGETATVTAQAINGSGDYEYIWTVPAGADKPGDVFSFQTKVPGEYQVHVKDKKGCVSSVLASSTVVFTPKAKPLLGEITAENQNGPITPSNQIAINDRVTFSLVSEVINNGKIDTYKWYIGDGTDAGWKLQEGETGNKFVIDPVVEGAFAVKCEIYPGEGNCYEMQTLFHQQIIPLPVELLYFKATKRGSDVTMEWATASEQDNKGFEVQVSTDAKNFRSLGFVESKVGTSSLKQLYTFVDKENGKYGTRYYRLKQIDLDGKFEYFSAKAVHFGEVTVNKVKAYPNPFQSEVELSIDAEEGGNMLITVISATGQQLLQRTIKVDKGANIEKLQLDPNLPRGVYIISTRMGDLNSHFKLLKQ